MTPPPLFVVAMIVAYVLSHDRPAYPTKDQDYISVKIPVDAVYYPQQYPQNPLKR